MPKLQRRRQRRRGVTGRPYQDLLYCPKNRGRHRLHARLPLTVRVATDVGRNRAIVTQRPARVHLCGTPGGRCDSALNYFVDSTQGTRNLLSPASAVNLGHLLLQSRGLRLDDEIVATACTDDSDSHSEGVSSADERCKAVDVTLYIEFQQHGC